MIAWPTARQYLPFGHIKGEAELSNVRKTSDMACRGGRTSLTNEVLSSFVLHQPEVVKRLPYLYSSTCSVPCQLMEVSPACIEIGRCASIETISLNLLQWTQTYAGVIVTRNSHRLRSATFHGCHFSLQQGSLVEAAS